MEEKNQTVIYVVDDGVGPLDLLFTGVILAAVAAISVRVYKRLTSDLK